MCNWIMKRNKEYMIMPGVADFLKRKLLEPKPYVPKQPCLYNEGAIWEADKIAREHAAERMQKDS